MTIIFKKELRQLFGGVRGFAVISILLLSCGLYTVLQNMLMGVSAFSVALTGMIPALTVSLPILSAKSLADEQKCGTYKLLYSLSLRPSDIVLGKYFAHLTVFFLSMLAIALFPILLSFFGTVEMADAYFAWFGFVMFGASLLSICLFLSTISKNTWINWGISAGTLLSLYLLQVFLTSLPSAAWFSFAVIEVLLLGACLLLWLAVKSAFAAICCSVLPIVTAILFAVKPIWFVSLIGLTLSKINPFSRYAGFVYGRFDLEGIVFFLSVTVFFVFLTATVLSYRRDTEV